MNNINGPRWRSLKQSQVLDGLSARGKKIGKIVGLDKPQYTLPHVQWNEHINNKIIGGSQSSANKSLMNLRRFLPLKIN
jgi:hypothetical protein